MCFDFLYKFCLKHFSFSEELSGMWSKIYIGHVQYQLFLTDIMNFLNSVLKHSNFMKIRPVGIELFHADGRTDGRANTWRSYQLLFAILRTRLKTS
jgi:hypothetical protein